MPGPPRLALFADSFHEVNGVALTCRQFEAFAVRRGLPFLSVHAGPETRIWGESELTRCELATSAMVLHLEQDLYFDLLFMRHRKAVLECVTEFRPDLIHITGPSHFGFLGAWIAHSLGIPMAASWHTNVHEYAARRLAKILPHLPPAVPAWAEKEALALTAWFYEVARLHFAPNPELCRLLAERTGRPCYLMPRGVDCELYSPARRVRADDVLIAGYVGRISPEKSVQRLIEVERHFRAAGIANYRLLVIGHGSQSEFLRQHLLSAEFPGVLKGEELARAYAGMDIFLFPSETDTYGNVIQEAMASGVPCIVTDQGGPRYLVDDRINGFITSNGSEFCRAAVTLATQPELRAQMSREARARALRASWDAVFEGVYAAYAEQNLPSPLQ